MADAFLTKLYHPSGIPEWDNEPSPEARRAALLHLMDTPGLRAEAELRRKVGKGGIPLPKPVSAPTGAVSAKSGMWKGSTSSDGEVFLPGNECQDAKCILPHVERSSYCERDYCHNVHKYHIALYPARVYTHPSGAIAKVRADKGAKP